MPTPYKAPFAVIIALTWLTTGCGLPGGKTTPNDPAPNGTLLSSGRLYGLNGKTISGAVSVYQTNSGNTYLIRIEGLSVDTDVSLQLVAVSTTTPNYQSALRNNRGTQNYDTGIYNDGRTWVSVTLRKTSGGTTPEYGKADLTIVN